MASDFRFGSFATDVADLTCRFMSALRRRRRLFIGERNNATCQEATSGRYSITSSA
jgi:hypothetical protein